MRLKKGLKKILSVIATLATILNSLGAPVAVIAQEITPEPTIAPTEESTSSPESTPTDIASPTPEVTVEPTPGVEETTPAPETSQPETQNTTSENTQSQAPPSGEPTASASPSSEPTPTVTPIQPDEEGSLTAEVLETDLFSETLQENPWFKLITDKLDYAPTEAAVITGTGFTAGETYSLTVSSTDEPATSTTVDVVADSDGSFTYVYQLDGIYRPNYLVEVKEENTLLASITFTDAPGDPDPAIDLYDQCSNDDGGGYTTGDTGCRWIFGNLQQSNSTYYEGDSTVQRLAIDGLLTGDYTVTIKYGTTKGGKHAYDFITDDKYSETWITDADICDSPLGNIPNCSSLTPSNSGLIPTDPNAGGKDVTVSARHFQIRNGTWSNTGTIVPGVVAGPTLFSGSYAGDSETTIQLKFHVDTTTCDKYNAGTNQKPIDACEVLITFGAHVSNQQDWGAGTSAISIPGSPYHVSLEELNGGAVGARDNQMQANAVVVPGSTITVNKVVIPSTDLGLFNLNIDGTPYANNVGDGGTTGPVIVTTAGTHIVSETAGTTTSLSDYTTTYACVDGQTSIASGSTTSSSAFSIEPGQNIVCTFTNTRNAGKIELQKDFVGTPENVTIKIGTSQGGNEVDSDVLSSDGTDGEHNVNTGTYYVSEVLTTPSNYATSLACYNDTDDSSHSVNTGTGAVTVGSGEDVICVFTNTRNTGSIKVNKLADSDGNNSFETANPVAFTWSLDGSGTNAMGSTLPNIDTGSHNVNENSVTDYHLVGWFPGGVNSTQYSCTSLPVGASYQTLPASVSVTSGQTTEITICNARDTGTIQVVKNVVPDDGGTTGWDFSIAGPTPNSANDLQDTESSSVFTSVTGSYTVTETAHTGTSGSNYDTTYSCSDNTGILASGSTTTTGSFNLATGKNVVCTFTNTIKNGHIIVNKVTVGGDDTFGFTTTGTGYDGFSLSNGQLNDQTVLPGAYTVAESAKTGWSSDGGVCNNDESPASLDVGPGETVTCTFTNTKLGTIIVEKQTNPDGASGNFTFTGTASGTISDGGQITVNNLTPGQYSSIETDPTPGFDLTNISCDDANSTGDVDNRTATFNVEAGETVTCTFTNTKRGSIQGRKYEDLNGDGNWDSGEPYLDGWTIHISDGESEIGSMNTGDDNTPAGSVELGQYKFINLEPGTYTLCEDLKTPGWIQTEPAASGCREVTVDPGEVVTGEHFGNLKLGIIQSRKYEDINVDSEHNDGEEWLNSWTIRLYDEEWEQYGSDVVTGEGSLEDGQYRFEDLPFGTYYICEVLQDGWAQTDPSSLEGYANESGAANEAPRCRRFIVDESGDETIGERHFGNAPLGSIHGVKWNDLNGDGERCSLPILNEESFIPLAVFDENFCEPLMSGWTVFIDENNNSQLDGEEPFTQTSNDNEHFGWYWFSNLLPGTYKVCEVQQNGWNMTYPASCHTVQLPDINPYNFPEARNFVEGPVYDFGNQEIILDLNIEKSNDKEAGASKGDTVNYTLTVKNDGNQPVYNLDVLDTLPGGFTYVSGSTTGATTSDPSVSGNNLTWNDVDAVFESGESLTLNYQVKIAGDVSDGTYVNFATCKADLSGNGELSLAAVDGPTEPETTNCDTVDSSVPIGSNPSFGGRLGQVLGLSTELPATGSPTGLALIALGLIGVGFILKKKYVKN